MTDEEMAEEYAKLNARQYIHNDGIDFCTSEEEVKQAYLAGLKAGRPEWHSPNEHISKNKVVIGIIKHCNKPRYSLVQWNGEFWFQYGTYNAEVRLIAWCEIPKYTEE